MTEPIIFTVLIIISSFATVASTAMTVFVIVGARRRLDAWAHLYDRKQRHVHALVRDIQKTLKEAREDKTITLALGSDEIEFFDEVVTDKEKAIEKAKRRRDQRLRRG